MLKNVGLRKSVEQPVLDLNFAASQIGSNAAPDSRIDFSRGTNAWFVDSDGLVKKSPHNLLRRSEDLTTTSFTKANVTVTNNAASAPDGTTTATKLEKTANTFANVNQNFLGATATHAASLYLKAGTNTTATVLLTSDNGSTLNSRHTIDLSAGTITNLSSASMVTTTIEDVGDGWYRFTTIATFANNTSTRLYIYPDVYNSSNAGFIYIWHPQVSQHTTLPVDNPYVKTEGSAVYAARLDHDPSWFMSAAQDQNLLRYSEMLDQSGGGLQWAGEKVIITGNAGTDPLGGSTAEIITENTQGGSHNVKSPDFSVTEGTAYTLSAYVKINSGDRIIRLAFTSVSSAFTFAFATFNLSDEAVVSSDTTAAIESVGNGWFRVSIQSAAATATVEDAQVSLHLVNNVVNYTGDGTSGFLIWGVQVEVGSTAGTYHRTEGAPYYGPGATAKGLLIEEQRANLLTNSDNVLDRFSHQNSTETNDQVLSPNGTVSGDSLVPDTNNASHTSFISTLSISASTSYAYSMFVKANGYDFVQLTFTGGFGNNDVWANFNLSTGATASKGSAATSSIEDYGNGWFRCVVIGTTGASATTGGPAFAAIGSDTASRDPSFAGDGTSGIFVWGAQLEQASFATSYIENISDAAGTTRNADVATMGPTTGGTELVTNGTFDTDVSNWNAQNSTLSHQSGKIRVTSDGGAFPQANQAFSTVIGRRYRITADIDFGTSSNARVQINANAPPSTFTAVAIRTADATITFDFTANHTTSTVLLLSDTSSSSAGEYQEFDNVSVRELYPFEQFNNTDGTFVVDAAGLDVPAQTVMQVDQGAINTAPYLRCSILDTVSARIFATISSSPGDSFDGSVGVNTASENRVAFAYGTDPSDGVADKVQAATNGTVQAEGTTDASIGGFERVLLGSGAFFSDPAAAIKRIRYFNRRLLTQELKAITDD